jgi:potassium-transporting ATPase potassium-binding subunit
MSQEIVFTILQDVVYFVLLMGLAFLFGKAFYKIYRGQAVYANILRSKFESFLYRMMGVDPEEDMSAKKYGLCILLFSVIGLLFLLGLLMLQGFLLLNPNGAEGMDFALAFNTAVSFLTNTDWQAYSGETQASYLAQTLGLTVENFLSGAVGISVLFALFRGFERKQSKGVGNFWIDMTRIVLFMIPVSIVGALLLVSQGVPQTFEASVEYVSLEGGDSVLYLGPVASQVIIKQLFTNGGGFYGANSAYPFENPTPLSNLIESLSILVIPAGLCFTFGEAVGDRRQGFSLLAAMNILFVSALVALTAFELFGSSLPSGISSVGNIEGKEVRFGVGSSSLWAAATTAASNGSVSCMHDSLTSVGGMVTMLLMMLGEIVYGGVGSGLYGMIAFAILTVFIACLMVGRTPEYLKKKIGSFDMKMVCLIFLPSVLLTLIGTASTVLLPSVDSWLTNHGAHGFSEILYAFASLANNNGSAFAGLAADNLWIDIVGGVVMLIVRFVPLFAALALAGSLANKKIVPQSDGTLSTTNVTFVALLIFVILIIGALSFFPALALGPLAEFLG